MLTPSNQFCVCMIGIFQLTSRKKVISSNHNNKALGKMSVQSSISMHIQNTNIENSNKSKCDMNDFKIFDRNMKPSRKQDLKKGYELKNIASAPSKILMCIGIDTNADKKCASHIGLGISILASVVVCNSIFKIVKLKCSNRNTQRKIITTAEHGRREEKISS